METSQVKTQIAEILKKENIKHVFHVDDRVSSFSELRNKVLAKLRLVEYIREDQNISKILGSHKIDFDNENDFIIEEVSKMLIIDNYSLLKELSAIFALNEEDGEDDDNDAYEIAEYFIKEQFSALEPQSAIDTIKKKIAQIGNDGKVLVLFDLDLKEAGGDFLKITGVDMLIKLRNEDSQNQCICSIFTHLVKTTNDEIQKRKAILRDNSEHLSKLNLFVLAKKRKNNSLFFGDGIKKIILNPHYEKIKEHSISVLHKVLNSSCEELADIDTYEFDHMILHASNIEGVWAGETLLRIFNVIFDRHIRQEFIAEKYAEKVNPFFERAIKLGRNVFPVDLKDIPEFNRNRIRNFELYTEDALVNALFEPINNGDIFEITTNGTKQTYVLVAQECDIILRSNGKRNRKNDFFSLLKIDFKDRVGIEEDILKFSEEYGLKNHFFSNKFLLNNYDNSNSELIGVVDFRNEVAIYSLILDLTSINVNGSSKYDPQEKYNISAFSLALKNRFTSIQKICADKISFLNKTEAELAAQGVQAAHELTLRFIETVSPTNKQIGNPDPYQNQKFDFGITRKKRLKTNWANKLLERYGFYLSRPAESPDYTEKVDPKSLRIS